MSQNKRIVLSGFYGFDNQGDEAILISIIQQLKKADFIPVVLSNNPEKTSRTYNVESYHRMKIKDVVKAIRSSDALISGGGSLLQDVTSVQNVFYYLGIIKIAQFFKKKTFVYAQGIGPIHNEFLYKPIYHVLKKCDYLSVRDTESLGFLNGIGLSNVELTCDPVLGIETEQIELNSKIRSFLNKKPVVFSIRYWKENRHLEEFSKTVKILLDRNIPVLFLPFHFPHDLECSDQVIKQFKNHELLFVVRENLSVFETLEIIRSSNLIVGIRLHALIFASSQNTPFIGVSYDPKIDSFMNQIHNDNLLFIDEFSHEQLVENIFFSIKEGSELKLDLEENLTQLQSLIQLPIQSIQQRLYN